LAGRSRLTGTVERRKRANVVERVASFDARPEFPSAERLLYTFAMIESEGACPACGGSGGGPFGPAGSAWDDDSYRCPACKGLGVVAVVASTSAVVASSGTARALAPLAKGPSTPAPSAPTRKGAALARTQPAKRAPSAASTAGLKKR